jgi:hypothetical protein
MWMAIFSIAIAVSICLIVAAIMMQNCNATSAELTTFSAENPSVRADPIDPDLNSLVASPEVQSMMSADHVEMREMLAELNAVSVQLQRNAGSIFTFDVAANRLRNMSEMMDRLGFDTETLARTELNVSSVIRACQICPADEVCHNWLARAPKSFKQAPSFCPNAERYARAIQAMAA